MTLCHKDTHPLLLEYFLTSIWCTRMVGRATDSVSDSLMAIALYILPKLLPSFKQNIQLFGTTSAREVWYCVVRISIHCCLSVSYAALDVQEWSAEPLKVYLIPLWSSQCSIFYQNHSQVSSKISDSGQYINMENMILCCKDDHSLLLKCFLTSLRCVWMIVRPPNSIYDPLMVITVSFLLKTTLNFQAK